MPKWRMRLPNDAAVQRLRASVPADVLLLFRLGDFTSCLRTRRKRLVWWNVADETQRLPMRRPYHAAQKLHRETIKAGKRVAIYDQTSEPQPGADRDARVPRSSALKR